MEYVDRFLTNHYFSHDLLNFGHLHFKVRHLHCGFIVVSATILVEILKQGTVNNLKPYKRATDIY
jgi:hypothetical protein